MTEEKVHIHSVGQLYLAELIRQMLADNDIPAFIINKQDSAYKFGDIEIYTYRDGVIPAKKLIQEFESQ